MAPPRPRTPGPDPAGVAIPARVDAWLLAALALATLGMLAVVFPLLTSDTVALALRLLIGGLGVGTVAAGLAVTVPVRYVFEGGGVYVRAGLITMRLAYPDIAVASKVLSPLSGAAWSWVKVRLVLRQGGMVEIAPRDREAFLAELARRAPHLRSNARGLRDPSYERR
jgi:hypothetical protein